MNNNRFQRSSSSSQEVSRYGQKSRTNYNSQSNGNGYNNSKFSQRNNNSNENSNNYSKFSQRNKFNSFEKNSFSNKFSQRFKTQYSKTKNTRISTNISVNKPKETLVETFPSLPSKTSPKPVVKQKPVVKSLELKTNNPWGKKNVIQHIKQCYKEQNNERKIEANKRQKAIIEANKRRIQQDTNRSTYKSASYEQTNLYGKKHHYDSENDEYRTDDDNEEYMGWGSD